MAEVWPWVIPSEPQAREFLSPCFTRWRDATRSVGSRPSASAAGTRSHWRLSPCVTDLPEDRTIRVGSSKLETGNSKLVFHSFSSPCSQPRSWGGLPDAPGQVKPTHQIRQYSRARRPY